MSIIDKNNENTQEIEQLNDEKPKFSSFNYIFLGILILLALVVFGYLIYSMTKGKFSFMNSSHETTTVKTKNFESAPENIDFFVPPAPKVEEQTIQENPIQENDIEVVRPNVRPQSKEENPDELLNSRLSSEINSSSINVNISNDSTQNNVSDTENSPASSGLLGNSPPVSNAKVTLLDDVDYTLLKGTILQCTLETNIIAERPGFTSCVITKDVYSSNGRILLVEKGSRVTGEYDSLLSFGQKRLSVAWDRIVTPYNISVDLDSSPTTGKLGAAGISGKVDNRYLEKYGHALLVSSIGDLTTYLLNRSRTSTTTFNPQTGAVTNSSSRIFGDRGLTDTETYKAVTGITKEILNESKNIHPVVYIEQGTLINVIVNDDINFSSVYEIANE